MSKHVVKHLNNFTQITNDIFKDKNLSNAAVGLLCRMLSLPDNWEYSEMGLAAICKDGITSIKSSLRELEQYGYLFRSKVRKNGRVVGSIYDIYESPNIERLSLEKLRSEKLILERIDNKDNNNKDNNNKDTISKDIGESKDSPSNKSNNKSNISNKNKKISLDDLENMTYLDIESNFRKSQNQRVLLAYINKSINSKKIIEELTEWLQLSYLHKRPLYLSGLINQLELLNGFSEEEIISIIKNCTLADKSTFKYEIEKREREKKYQNYNKQNQPRVTSQKRTSSLGNEVF